MPPCCCFHSTCSHSWKSTAKDLLRQLFNQPRSSPVATKALLLLLLLSLYPFHLSNICSTFIGIIIIIHRHSCTMWQNLVEVFVSFLFRIGTWSRQYQSSQTTFNTQVLPALSLVSVTSTTFMHSVFHGVSHSFHPPNTWKVTPTGVRMQHL